MNYVEVIYRFGEAATSQHLLEKEENMQILVQKYLDASMKPVPSLSWFKTMIKLI